MTDTFPLFQRLPPEVRHQIWHMAFEDDWTFAALQRDGRRLKLVGVGRQVVRQSCREARRVMELTHTYVEHLGWIDFAHTLLYFRDEKADHRLMQRADVSQEILPHIHHLVLCPASWKRLYQTVDRVKSSCISLRTLVISAPWPDPPPPTMYHYGWEYAPYQDFSPLFHDTPGELLVEHLVEAVRRDEAANSEFYKTKLDQALELVPPTGTRPRDCSWRRCKKRVQEMEQACEEFSKTKPTLSLVRKVEIDPRTVFVSWEDKFHTWTSHQNGFQREKRLRREESGFILWPVPDIDNDALF